MKYLSCPFNSKIIQDIWRLTKKVQTQIEGNKHI